MFIKVKVEIDIVLNLEEGTSLDTAIQNLDYKFSMDEEYGEVVHHTIDNFYQINL